MNRKTYNIEGKKFGMLTVIKEDNGRAYGGQVVSLCRCDCGNVKEVMRANLINNHVKSCGCLNIKLATYRILHAEKYRKPLGQASFNKLLATYKRNAMKRGLSFELTNEQFRDITSQNCHYCGVEPLQVVKTRSNNGDYVYNGIDRVNNNIGYTVDNSVPCCYICNQAKHNLSYEKFLSWISKIKLNSLKENVRRKDNKEEANVSSEIARS